MYCAWSVQWSGVPSKIPTLDIWRSTEHFTCFQMSGNLKKKSIILDHEAKNYLKYEVLRSLASK